MGQLNEARRGIRLVFVKDTLYAMGGFNGKTKKYVSTVERFDFKTKTWSKVEDMLAARAFPGVVAVPEELFKCEQKAQCKDTKASCGFLSKSCHKEAVQKKCP